MLCVIAKLNRNATERLASLQAFSFPGKPTPLYGHITLATYIGDDEAQFIQFCKSFIQGIPSFPIRYHRVEVLEASSIIVASPVKSGVLESIHQRIAAEYNHSLNSWTQSEQWYPHTTLLYAPNADLHRICCKMAASFAPFSTQISRIEFSRVLESGYEIIETVELPDQ